MNELDIYSEDAITWTSRNDCVIDCAESWRQFDAAGWQLIAKVSKAKESYGATILIDIAEGETLRELRRLQDALRGVFSDEGWKQSGVMLRYPFGG